MNEILPDLRQLKAFVAVAEEGSFTRAAKKLFLTQSAVSHSIRALEDSLDCKLLTRLSKKAVPTEQGSVVLKRCKTILTELEQIGQDLDGLKRWGQSRIRIGAPHSLCHFLLPTVLREFCDCFPRCEPSLESGDTEVLLDRLANHELDVVLGLNFQNSRDAGVRSLFRDRMAFVVPPMHPWSEKGIVPGEELENAQFIIYARASETHKLIENYFRENHARLKAPLVLGDMEAIKQMAKIGMGVGIVAEWVIRKEVEEGTLVSLKIGDNRDIEREWVAFWNVERPLSLVEETFMGISRMVGENLARRLS